MANWKLNYGLNLNGEGSDKLKCNATNKGGNGLQVVMGGDLPDGGPAGAVEGMIVKAMSMLDGLDGLDASKPENHVKYLRTVAGFCNSLADTMEG